MYILYTVFDETAYMMGTWGLVPNKWSVHYFIKFLQILIKHAIKLFISKVNNAKTNYKFSF